MIKVSNKMKLTWNRFVITICIGKQMNQKMNILFVFY